MRRRVFATFVLGALFTVACSGPADVQTDDPRPRKAGAVSGPYQSPGVSASGQPVGFQPFNVEVEALGASAGCSNPKTTPAEMGLGALFGCIEGPAQTAKLFVNEEPGTGRVANVKVMWNDWFRDVGYGMHPDRLEAERLLDAVLARYAEDQAQQISEAYFSGRDHESTSSHYRLRVTHTRGTGIEEHLLTITAQ